MRPPCRPGSSTRPSHPKAATSRPLPMKCTSAGTGTSSHLRASPRTLPRGRSACDSPRRPRSSRPVPPEPQRVGRCAQQSVAGYATQQHCALVHRQATLRRSWTRRLGGGQNRSSAQPSGGPWSDHDDAHADQADAGADEVVTVWAEPVGDDPQASEPASVQSYAAGARPVVRCRNTASDTPGEDQS